jgi:hypothetical protein
MASMTSRDTPHCTDACSGAWLHGGSNSVHNGRRMDQGVGKQDGSFTVTNARNGFSKTYGG